MNMEEKLANAEAVLDKVIFKKVAKTNTKGGLFLPPDGYRQVMCGKVIAVGPGRVNQKGVFIPTTLNVGDYIVYDSTSAFKIDTKNVDDFGVRWTTESCVLGIMEDPDRLGD